MVGYLVWTQFFAKRGDEETPANRKQFLSDEDLEGRRLERVLGWSLLFVTMFAVVFLVYLVREPARQEESIEYFEEGSVERGRDVVRQLVDARVRRCALVAVRQLPRHRGWRRLDDAGDRP